MGFTLRQACLLRQNLKNKPGYHYQKLIKKLLRPGIPQGHIVLLRGHSDTGKTTAMIEGAVAAQKRGILPVFIITEMKWSWEHAKMMGLEINEVVDEETGEVVDYNGKQIQLYL